MKQQMVPARVHEVAIDTRDTIIKNLKTNVFSLATDGSNEVSYKLYALVVVFADSNLEVKTDLLAILD